MATIAPLAKDDSKRLRKEKELGVSGLSNQRFKACGPNWPFLYAPRVVLLNPNCEQGKHGFCDRWVERGDSRPCACSCRHHGCADGTAVQLATVGPSHAERHYLARGGRTAAVREEEGVFAGRVLVPGGSSGVQGYAGRGWTGAPRSSGRGGGLRGTRKNRASAAAVASTESSLVRRPGSAQTVKAKKL